MSFALSECEIPQGHSCTRKEKSKPALSFRVLAVKKVNPIKFSRFCLAAAGPGLGGGVGGEQVSLGYHPVPQA